MRGLEDLDAGYVALDFQRFYLLELTDKLLKRRTWHWLLKRAYVLLDMPDTLTRREATRGV